MNQQDFGERAGLSQPQYNQFETGKRRLTIEAALNLCHVYSITLDYLYRGDQSGLRHWLVMRIDELRMQGK